MRRGLLVKEPKNVIQSAYIWNTIAAVVNASEAIIIQMFTTRFVGLEETGILAIAFTTANLLMTVGKFGIRNYHVTDTKRIYSFSEYRMMRVITLGFMALITALYLAVGYMVNGNGMHKNGIILGIVFLYAADVLEDLFWGEYQRNNRLDVGAKMFTIRWMNTIAAFLIALCFSRNVLFATGVAVCVCWGSLLFLIIDTKVVIGKNQICMKKAHVKILLRECAPLCGATFLLYFITNSSKYAIDLYMTDDIQALYGFVFMPVFIICTLNSVLYQPFLVGIAEAWNSDIHKFKKMIRKQNGIIAIISLICVLVAGWIGIPVLSTVFHVSLEDFWLELIVLVLSGSALACVNFWQAVLISMRKQKAMLWIYIAASALAVGTMGRAVKIYGTLGGAVMSLILILLIAILFGSFICIEYFRKKRLS